MTAMKVVEVSTPEQVAGAAHLFDHPVRPDAVARFLTDPTHHLLLAVEGEQTVGFVTGVETTHPDKGTEMFLYELAVAEAHRRRGVGTQLVRALADLARRRGCYGMWVVTEPDNEAAQATYRAAGAPATDPTTTFVWTFPG
jgi:ribosomal protein S18 acetylase RimI-like enzyme